MFRHPTDTPPTAIAIDPGATRSRFFSTSAGLLFDEPSIAALDRDDPDMTTLLINGFGDNAVATLHDAPSRYQLLYPVNQDADRDSGLAASMLHDFLRRADQQNLINHRSTMILALPASLANETTRLYIEACKRAGAEHVTVADQAIASAVGCGINRHNFDSPVLLDIGARGARMCGFSAGEMVFHRDLEIGSDRLDQQLIDAIDAEFALEIQANVARDLKQRIGTANWNEQRQLLASSRSVKGRDSQSGQPRDLRISADTVHQLLKPTLDQLQWQVAEACELLPAALADSLHRNGLLLCGGGALLPGMEALVAEASRAPAQLTERPLSATVRGAATLLDNALKRSSPAHQGQHSMVG